jgi:hypothetical protein
MNAKQQRRLRISEAIISWPLELCTIVADYAIPNVRWSADQKPNVAVSPDGLQAELVDISTFRTATNIDGCPYDELIADQPLQETDGRWTMRLSTHSQANGWYRFRIGIRPADGPAVLSPDIVFRNQESMMSLSEFATAWNPQTVRFSLTADLRTGDLSAKVWSTVGEFQPIDDWFSAKLEPNRLAAAVPVVYLWLYGSTADLVFDAVLP